MLPELYYQDSSVQIFHGRCEDILPQLDLSEVTLLLTDPPYGLGERWSGGTWGAAPMYADAKRWDVVVDLVVDPTLMASLLRVAETAIIWGGNYYSLPPSRGFLAWIKNPELATMADLEYAWTNLDRPAKAYRSTRNPDGKRFHPTEKPLGLMRWCINQAPASAGAVFDPFMGGGTTLRAAKEFGRQAIGIEAEERYCEIAAERCRQECLDLWGN
jgi:site-specific DNA-methyltransferase (adenine-specific)